MIHPAFEWIDESMDFSDVLTALGFASEFVTPDFDNEQDWIAFEDTPGEDWLADWHPEGEGTLIAKYIDNHGEPVAVFVTPQTELAAVLLTWKPGQLVAWTESQALLEEATEVLGPAYDPAGAEMLRARILEVLDAKAELLPFGDQYWLPGME